MSGGGCHCEDGWCLFVLKVAVGVVGISRFFKKN
jgi:hypothetical protein